MKNDLNDHLHPEAIAAYQRKHKDYQAHNPPNTFIDGGLAALSFNQSHTEPEGKQEPIGWIDPENNYFTDAQVWEMKRTKGEAYVSDLDPLYDRPQQIATNENAVEIGKELEKHIEIVKQFNNWRRRQPNELSSAKDIGIAIDAVVKAAELSINECRG